MKKKDGEHEFEDSLNSKVVVSCGCTCNLKKMTTIQNNMGTSVTHVSCRICNQEWEITINRIEEEEEEDEEDSGTSG